MLSCTVVAAFLFQQQSYLLAIEITWLAKWKYLLSGPLQEKNKNEKKDADSWFKQYLISNSMILEKVL